jgi:hypothetical protein
LPRDQQSEATKSGIRVEQLKWNTPIRSGASLQALILLKNHSWMFGGFLTPLTAATKQCQLSGIRDQIDAVLKTRSQQESIQLSGRLKEASRELPKIDFVFMLRQQPDKLWDFITITSPSQKVQFVYHEFIEEVEVDNPQQKVIFYSRVKGKFKGIFDFPIKLKVVLEEK